MTLILCDTNVLLRLAKPDHPDHEVARDALRVLAGAGYMLALVPQCCYEYYVVATRPVERNGLGMSPSHAGRDVDRLIRRFRFLRDERGVFDGWSELVEQYDVRGKPAHDARLAAAAFRHGAVHLLTFNGSDFVRYVGLTVIAPAEAAAFAANGSAGR
ncbi:type II toxin-antitoxin system VapC family toxin [Alienimonas sp. DA493]|uniref:type II toxin-antitoxin system VapC family toxin n=1 Tax=Alienimonas sp. DA493 TaxID=3373605 RepID=UPI003754B411